jgi:hypothetical protein
MKQSELVKKQRIIQDIYMRKTDKSPSAEIPEG